MKLLLLILSVMTFTVETKSKVSLSGETPSGISAEYACSYQKGSVRKDDTATLTLTKTGDINLQSVTIYLRSNKSAGAGILTVYGDGEVLSSHSGTYHDWFGAYNNENFQPLEIVFPNTAVHDELQIRLEGTANSLHIEKYEIKYTIIPSEPKKVTLYREGQVWRTLQESSAGAGVTLPGCENPDGWHFCGWASSDLKSRTTSAPALYLPEKTFVPQRDDTLYAVWTTSQAVSSKRLGSLTSGYYTIEFPARNFRLHGAVVDGRVPVCSADSKLTEEDIYYLDFNEADSICSIRHYQSDTYLGYDQSALSQTQSDWQVYLLRDSSFLFFCHPQNGDADIFYREDMNENPVVTMRRATLSHDVTGLWTLYAVSNPEEPAYWYSYPSTTPIHTPKAEQRTYVLPMGIYELHINNGKKTIYLRQ